MGTRGGAGMRQGGAGVVATGGVRAATRSGRRCGRGDGHRNAATRTAHAVAPSGPPSVPRPPLPPRHVPAACRGRTMAGRGERGKAGSTESLATGSGGVGGWGSGRAARVRRPPTEWSACGGGGWTCATDPHSASLHPPRGTEGGAPPPPGGPRTARDGVRVVEGGGGGSASGPPRTWRGWRVRCTGPCGRTAARRRPRPPLAVTAREGGVGGAAAAGWLAPRRGCHHRGLAGSPVRRPPPLEAGGGRGRYIQLVVATVRGAGRRALPARGGPAGGRSPPTPPDRRSRPSLREGGPHRGRNRGHWRRRLCITARRSTKATTACARPERDACGGHE